MKNLSILYVVCLLTLGSSSSMLFAQEQTMKHIVPGTRDAHPKNIEEWGIYIRQALTPKVKQIPIEQYFKAADIVLEGRIVQKYGSPQRPESFRNQKIYEIEPYTIFKGMISKSNTIKIVVVVNPEPDTPHIGSWNNGPWPQGIFFLKQISKQENTYSFINTEDAWISYNRYVNLVRCEQHLQEIVHDKIITLESAKYKKTSFYRKKRRNYKKAHRAKIKPNDQL